MKPGDLLSWCIREVTGVTPSQCSGCSGHVQTMNSNGWWWCWRKRDAIQGWLVESCRKMGYRLPNNTARALVTVGFMQFIQHRKNKHEER